MAKTISESELAEIMDARDKMCDFCDGGNCSSCKVEELANEAMNSVGEDEDEEE